MMRKLFKIATLFSCSFIAAVYANEAFQCGKRTCSQMNSCEEARFHLTQCGVKSLDRDNDGIPCESICGGKKKKK